MSSCNFFVPGPTWVRPEVLAEMTRPMIGHRSNEFKELFRRIRTNLAPLFATQHDTFVATCSGTAILEAALLNAAPKRLLVTTCGAFSERWLKIAESLGIAADRLEHAWGEAVDPDRLRNHLASTEPYDAVTITHNETSTGVTNDLATLARIVHERAPETLVLVDAVSSLGGIPVKVDEWGLDVCLASVQKGIALPPGITVFAVSPRVLDRAKQRVHRGTYFDFLDYKKNADGDSVPTTPSIPHFYALAKQLDDIASEGLGARFARHVEMRDLTIRRTAPFAKLASDRAHASPTVSALAPEGMTAEALKSEMKRRGFTIGGGYGQWKDSTFRIGHMGDMTVADVSTMLDALEDAAKALSS